MIKDRIEEDAPFPVSRPLAVTAVPPGGLDLTIRPNEEQCAALAQQNKLRALTGLEAHLHVSHAGAEGLEVSGVLRARVRQTCVLTLEDFDAEIEEPVHLRFAPPPAALAAQSGAESLQIVDIDEDAPDPLIGGVVDLGAIVCEFLALGIDPYPRRPGAQFVEPAPRDIEDSPFAILRRGPARSAKTDDR
jgi:hypothetical protein